MVLGLSPRATAKYVPLGLGTGVTSGGDDGVGVDTGGGFGAGTDPSLELQAKIENSVDAVAMLNPRYTIF
ncbi:hypothetical protein ACFLYR_03655 [Chloroflexota bacterium]